MLKKAETDDCVTVSVPQFDRSNIDPANLIGIILDIKDDKYQIGTRGGIINNWMKKNAFELTKYNN